MRKIAAAAALAAVATLAACSGSRPATHTTTHTTTRPLPAYSQPGPIACAITKGAVLVLHVPGDGLRARLSEVAVKYQVGGNSWFEHVFSVPGGVIPARGMTLTWDDRPGRIGRCKAVSYVP